jgi:hypothetical protein
LELFSDGSYLFDSGILSGLLELALPYNRLEFIELKGFVTSLELVPAYN